MSDIMGKLEKIKALADGTSNENERKFATKKLDELMAKYGIAEHEFCDDAITTHMFKYRGERERDLLEQILSKVFNASTFSAYSFYKNGRKLSGKMGVDCTVAQQVEISLLFDFYRELYKREEKMLFRAFVIKHNLCAASGETKEISSEEADQMISMMRGMSDGIPQKRLTSGE